MISSFVTFKRMGIAQEAKQLQTALVSMLASIHEGVQQTVDILGQHTATPRVFQHLAQCHVVGGRAALAGTFMGEGRVQVILSKVDSETLFVM